MKLKFFCLQLRDAKLIAPRQGLRVDNFSPDENYYVVDLAQIYFAQIVSNHKIICPTQLCSQPPCPPHILVLFTMDPVEVLLNNLSQEPAEEDVQEILSEIKKHLIQSAQSSRNVLASQDFFRNANS